MSLEILSRAEFAEPADADPISIGRGSKMSFAAAVTVLTVMLVSSLAVLMYLA